MWPLKKRRGRDQIRPDGPKILARHPTPTRNKISRPTPPAQQNFQKLFRNPKDPIVCLLFSFVHFQQQISRPIIQKVDTST